MTKTPKTYTDADHREAAARWWAAWLAEMQAPQGSAERQRLSLRVERLRRVRRTISARLREAGAAA